MLSPDTAHQMPSPESLAVQFAQALVNGAFDTAYRMLADDCAASLSPAGLRARYEKMTEYWEEQPAHHCKVVLVHYADELPDLRTDEIAWVHVSIQAEDYLEAVTVTVTSDFQLRIGPSGWGRP